MGTQASASLLRIGVVAASSVVMIDVGKMAMIVKPEMMTCSSATMTMY